MLNVPKVRGRMRELGITQKDVATALGVACPTASQKLNRIRPMDLDEAETLAKLLRLEDSEFGVYFFPDVVALRNLQCTNGADGHGRPPPAGGRPGRGRDGRPSGRMKKPPRAGRLRGRR